MIYIAVVEGLPRTQARAVIARGTRRGARGPFLAALLVLAFAVAGCGGSDSAEWTPQAGDALTEPVQLFSEEGRLEVTLTEHEATIDVSGSPIKARPFNDEINGPTLHVEPGDTLDVTIKNETDAETNIHYHGMHVSPTGISDNVLRVIEGHSSGHSVVHLPQDHATGTYWYHVHHHGDVMKQITGGMSGLLIVEGLKERLPPELREIEERQIALRDLAANGDTVALDHVPDEPTTRLVNGQLRPEIELGPGETQLWHVGNIGANIYYDLALEGHDFHVLAEDGSPVWEVSRTDHLFLPPGKRYDVLVRGGEEGRYEMITRHYEEGFQLLPRKTLASVTVAGEPQPSAEPPRTMAPRRDLSGAKIAKRRTFTFSMPEPKGSDEPEFLINGEKFRHDVVNVTTTLGTAEEWTLRNPSSETHPFHIHTDDFQVMSVNGKPYHARGLQDVVNLPRNGGEVVIRIPFEDFTGERVFHCHITDHEDAGMMQTVNVVRTG